MKIYILTPKNSWGFVGQAKWLAMGLTELGTKTQVSVAEESGSWQKQCTEFSPDIVLGVGSWDSYQDLVKKPQSLGFTTIPWFTCEGGGRTFVDEYNKLPLMLTTSRHCQNYFIEQGVNPKIIQVVPEAVDDKFWRPLDKSQSRHILQTLLARYQEIVFASQAQLDASSSDRRTILLTIGGDATSKGVRETMQALAKLDKKIPWHYIIKIWPSPFALRSAAEEIELAEKLGIADRCEYIAGIFSNEFLLDLFNLCDVYVAPSRWEGFGLPLVQAQMCGKPVITTDATATKETVLHGRTGYVSKSVATADGMRADIEDLSHGLEQILSNSELRNKMGQAALKHARSQYSSRRIASLMLEAISSLRTQK